VVVLAVAAGWMSLPKPPALDWREFFHLAVLTQIRGEVDKKKGDFKAWVARCEPLTGRLESDSAYDDPVDFGADYALSNSLGMGADWELLAEDPAAVKQRLLDRGQDLIWVCRGGGMSEALSEILPQVHCLEGPEEGLVEALSELLKAPSSRAVLVGEGEAAQAWTRLLQEQEANYPRHTDEESNQRGCSFVLHGIHRRVYPPPPPSSVIGSRLALVSTWSTLAPLADAG
jgi:hypothetical protein